MVRGWRTGEAILPNQGTIPRTRTKPRAAPAGIPASWRMKPGGTSGGWGVTGEAATQACLGTMSSDLGGTVNLEVWPCDAMQFSECDLRLTRRGG